MHTLGTGHKFLTYPRTVQTMQVKCKGSSCAQPTNRLQTRTSDGLGVSVAVSFQYRYDPTRLYDLYKRFDQQELEVFEDTSLATLSQVATNYTAYTFFSDLTGIAAAMRITLSDVFDRQLYTFIDGLQITEVDLPDEFENAIMASIQAQQNITTMERYRENMLVTFESELLVANQTRYQTIALAEGTAATRREEADATVEITQQTVLAEMYSFGNISETVGLDPTGSLSYIWWDSQAEEDHTGKEYLAGLVIEDSVRARMSSST